MCECKGELLLDLLPKSTSEDDKFLCVNGFLLGEVLKWKDGYLTDSKDNHYKLLFGSKSRWIIVKNNFL